MMAISKSSLSKTSFAKFGFKCAFALMAFYASLEPELGLISKSKLSKTCSLGRNLCKICLMSRWDIL